MCFGQITALPHFRLIYLTPTPPPLSGFWISTDVIIYLFRAALVFRFGVTDILGAFDLALWPVKVTFSLLPCLALSLCFFLGGSHRDINGRARVSVFVGRQAGGGGQKNTSYTSMLSFLEIREACAWLSLN
jgi:hypothetical protein